MFKLKCGQALCKFPILFSAMKFELRHNFSQFNYMFKMGTFDSWLYFQVFPNSQRDFWMLLQQELLICPNSWKRLNIEILEYFQDFPSSLDSWEIGIFPLLIFLYILSDCKDCLSGRVYMLDKDSQVSLCNNFVAG